MRARVGGAGTGVPWLLLMLLTLYGGSSIQARPFDEWATGRTLRFDYIHTGTAGEEHIALDRFRLEGEWPGRRGSHTVDGLGLGKYRFLVVDPDSEETLYSQGFSSIYGEWETTGEARSGWGAQHESQRFPEPKTPVRLVLEKRQLDGSFKEIYRIGVDPTSRFVVRSPVLDSPVVSTVFENGPLEQKVDLLILGDGYTREEQADFQDDARLVAQALFAFPPFRERKSDFNVRAAFVPTERSGITRPREGFFQETALGLSYNAFDSERYMLTFENARLREIAAAAPYDHLILIANSDKYGGGGIYNLYSTAAAKSGQMPYLIVHEFGHAFAGLGDEYYTSQVSYEEFTPKGVEPWEPNITALLDARSLKWGALATDGVPIPTPWQQEPYDRVSHEFQKQRAELRAAGASEKRMDAYFAEVKRVTTEMLAAEPHRGAVGAFEGAGYEAQGLYRPSVDCIMFSRNPDRYCPVCAAAIERVIRAYTDPD